MAAGSDERWHLKPGDKIERKVLTPMYGGSPQGGISHSRRTQNVMVFSDETAGIEHGYVHDGWRDDEHFHYTGEGKYGDQRISAPGNAAILNHKTEGRALRVFLGSRGTVEFLDEFDLAEQDPWYVADAPESREGRPKDFPVPTRKVVVFRLRPKTIKPRPSESPLDALPTGQVTDVPVEQQWTEKHFVDPVRGPYEAERREQALVLRYRDHLAAAGRSVSRKQIRPPGAAQPLYTDLFETDRNNLIEAKGSVMRGAIRGAIGQLADYRRFITPDPHLAVLLPERPIDDLVDLLTSQGIAVVWPDGGGFVDSAAGAFT